MISSSKRHLTIAVWSRKGVDPEEEICLVADANNELLLGRAGKRRLDHIEMSEVHNTP